MSAVLRELARAKVAFQLRTIEAIITAQVGRNGDRQDGATRLGPKDEHAVAESDAPK